MSTGAHPWLVTGANGHLGRKLCERLAGRQAVRAVVRSERAADQLRRLPEAARPEIRILRYDDADALEEAARGCESAIHLVGIIKEGGGARYEDSHEATCRVLARAAARAGVSRIVYMSILGSRPDAANACLASKGRAEEILLEGEVPATVLRVPMVLGEGDFASASLAAQARAPRVFLLGGGLTLQQPIDANDVISAVIAAAQDRGADSRALDLAGPETLSHRALVERSAALYGKPLRGIPIPLALVRGAVWALERVSGNPPMTTAMLGVLQHEDDVDPRAACEALGIELTPLDETLRRCVGPDAAGGDA